MIIGSSGSGRDGEGGKNSGSRSDSNFCSGGTGGSSNIVVAATLPGVAVNLESPAVVAVMVTVMTVVAVELAVVTMMAGVNPHVPK